MKLFLSVYIYIIVSIIFEYYANANSTVLSDNNGDSKFILFDLHFDDQCSYNSTGITIYKNNKCSFFKSVECNKAQGLVYYKMYQDMNCTTLLNSGSSPIDQCTQIFGVSTIVSCLDDIEDILPTKEAIVTVYTDSCNDWKSSFKQITTINTNNCVVDDPVTFEISCNSTSFTFNEFKDASCSIEEPNSSYVGELVLECNDQDNSFQYCL